MGEFQSDKKFYYDFVKDVNVPFKSCYISFEQKFSEKDAVIPATIYLKYYENSDSFKLRSIEYYEDAADIKINLEEVFNNDFKFKNVSVHMSCENPLERSLFNTFRNKHLDYFQQNDFNLNSWGFIFSGGTVFNEDFFGPYWEKQGVDKNEAYQISSFLRTEKNGLIIFSFEYMQKYLEEVINTIEKAKREEYRKILEKESKELPDLINLLKEKYTV